MTVIKTWTLEAHGVFYGQVGLWYEESTQTLRWTRGYRLLDESGEYINTTGFGLSNDMQGEMAWANIPADIKAALTTIDTYTKAQIKAELGI